MSKFGLRAGVDEDGSIRDLPGMVYIKVREALDTNPGDRNWRALAMAVEDKYPIKQATLENWSPALTGNSSPGGNLLTELSSRGMLVKELVQYLNQISVDTHPLGLSQFQPVRILTQPDEVKELCEGEMLCLHVEASGHPYPRYQWYFCKNGEEEFEPLQGRIEKILQLENMKREQAGGYACQIYNCGDAEQTQVTHNCLVSVVPIPNTPKSEFTGPHLTDLPYERMNGIQIDDENLQERSVMKKFSLITHQPMDEVVPMNSPFILTVETCGNPPISYQWFRNGHMLNGENYPKLHVQQALPVDFGEYHCMVSNGVVTEKSEVAIVKEHISMLGARPGIEMICHPKSVSVDFGGDAHFSCEARCSETLKYQWFRNGVPLQGKTRPELTIVNIQDRLYEGKYQCEVSLMKGGPGGDRCLTREAVLNVRMPTLEDSNVDQYHPNDKVALLIGNYDYRSEEPLNAPKRDVQMLAEEFRALDFKVVSLLNLTKTEIQNAVNHFCELLDRNVYAVFYFCGHGFEEEGLSFLVPTDARSGYVADECVCVDDVLGNIAKKDPPVIFMIMDICRKKNRVKGNIVHKRFERTRGNIAFCYATSEGLNAYENKSNGLLVQHLHPLLKKKIGIDDLIKELKIEFNRFPQYRDMQIPEGQSNLAEPLRSLTDKISHRGHTEASRKMYLLWKQCLEKPQMKNLNFGGIGVTVQLDFQSDFCNVLHVFCAVTNMGVSRACTVDVDNWPKTITCERRMINKGVPMKTLASFQDIQRLQSRLILDVAITFLIYNQYNEPVWRKAVQKVDLGYPLVSKLKLWQARDTMVYHRQPIEQGDESAG